MRDSSGVRGGVCAESVTALRALLVGGSLDLPLPGGGDTARRWAALSGWGRRDLGLARLAEGHTDAVAILAGAGRTAAPGVLYGVWAARSGGTGARLGRGPDAVLLRGTVRFCSGVSQLDRALVVADPPAGDPEGSVLVEVELADPWVVARPDTWRTAAMAGADTMDVRFDDVPVKPGAVIGVPGWYTTRPGFVLGGGGVAAVWWGGASGLLDRAIDHLPAPPDAHQLAHVGELHALREATHALLTRTAHTIDRRPEADHSLAVAAVRGAVERVAREVVDRVPRMVGSAALSRDAGLAGALADLQLYVRQHHGERDALGRGVVTRRSAR